MGKRAFKFYFNLLNLVDFSGFKSLFCIELFSTVVLSSVWMFLRCFFLCVCVAAILGSVSYEKEISDVNETNLDQ